MSVIDELKTDGIAKGLCENWQGKLTNNSSVKRLSEMYIRGIDFCISENYPTLEFMRDNFKGKCEPYGIFIDDENVSLANKESVVLNGRCEAELEYDGYSVSKIYIRHNSEAIIDVREHALVTVDVFDDSCTKIHSSDISTVLVYVYGSAKVYYSGKGVKISYKNKNSY